MVSLLHLALLADVNSAFTNLAKTFVGYLAGAFAFVLVIAGYHYLFAAIDDHNSTLKAKKMIGFAILGAMFIVLAIGLAETWLGNIKN